MKNNRIVAALLCASVSLATSAAFAQQMHGGPDDGHGGPAHQPYANNQPYAINQPQPQPGPRHDERADPRRDMGHDERHDERHDMGRPPVHADNGFERHEWRQGERLSGEYHDRQYVVDDWHGYGLRQPPRGYHWVGVGGDYLLVAVTSGIIAQIVLAR